MGDYMDNKLRKFTLDEMHAESIKILNDVASFCDKNDIHYILAYGSLLGAIRHNGFIPWDDDIDIAMPREDYERFLATYKSENGYKLFSYKSDPTYIFPFSKVSNIHDSLKYEYLDYGTHLRGIEIDIFVFDKCPNNKIKQLLTRLKVSYYRGFADFARYPHHMENNKLVEPLRKIAKRKGTLYWLKKLDKCTLKYNQRDYNLMWPACYPTQMKTEIIPKDAFNKRTKHIFEDQKYFIPENYKTVLTSLFGPDYMTPPPPKDRLAHDCEIYWKI